jgi:hypothetical protein
MDYVKKILGEQKTMLTNELRWAESESLEFTETKKRLEEVENALLILNSSSLKLNDKNTPTFEFWKKQNVKDVRGLGYMFMGEIYSFEQLSKKYDELYHYI